MSKRFQQPSMAHLVTFEAAARNGSFTRAADELSISQPAISHAMRELESDLGVSLFERRHKGVEATDAGRYLLEQVSLGLTLIDAPLDSRDPPQKDRVHRARALFRTIEYPVLIHCKSGADRAGMMAVFYRHFHLGEPISVAIEQLSKRYLHHREGLTGVLDYTLEKYLNEVEPTGVSFIDWIDSDAYDPKAIRAEFKAGWWGTILTDKLLRRE